MSTTQGRQRPHLPRKLLAGAATGLISLAMVVTGIGLAAAASAAPPSSDEQGRSDDPGGTGSAQHSRPGSRHHLDASQFHGLNWNDPRDNFMSGPVVPVDLSEDKSAAQIYTTSRSILLQFRAKSSANTVRMPVNPYSVGPKSAWWPKYRLAIKAAEDLGYRVILSYWEGSGDQKDGYVDDLPTWYSMWDTLIRQYRDNPRVFFEPMNEPHGYTSDQWRTLTADWLKKYDQVPRDRVLVSGVGYNGDASAICNDRRFDGTYVSLHNYAFWNTRDYPGWVKDFQERIQGCSGRIIVDEFGALMTTGIDYSASATSQDAETNNYVAFMQAATDLMRAEGLGSVYWSGLRTSEPGRYTLMSVHDQDGRITLTVNNASGLRLVLWGWGIGDKPPHAQP